MKYVLDTDTMIYFLQGHHNVVNHLANLPAQQIATTIFNHSELLFGAFNSLKKGKNLEKVQCFLNKIPTIAFCEESSYIFAQQKTALKNQGNIIADLDLMIASITLQNKAILVTNNTKHFTRIKYLKIQNWYN